jgi:hypothetical protein
MRGSTLIVAFDGLRRDRATSDLMPNLSRFMTEGADFLNSRSVFPSETRVAVTSVMTGCPPTDHGLVANQFYHPLQPDASFKTAEWDQLETAANAGQLLDCKTMGQRMAENSLKMAVISTASKGASRMMNSSAHALNQPVFTIHGPPVSSVDLHVLITQRIGDIPQPGTPNVERITYSTDALLDVIYPKFSPDMCVFWMSDPDITSHMFGVTSSETVAAQKACDDNFGRILAWWRAGNGPENIVVMSDHGQITGSQQLEKPEIIPAHIGKSTIGAFSGIYLDDPTDTKKAEVVDWLVQQDFCGLVFATATDGNAVKGAFTWEAVRNNHQRGPDVGFTLRSTNSSEGFSPQADSCIFAGGIPVGGGMHGGLSKGELSTVLAAQGPAYRSEFASDTPCWLPDIIPTILATMGLPLDGTTGRPMREALVGDDTRFGTIPAVETRVLSASLNGHEQYLRQWFIDGKTIVDCGWTAGTGAWVK